MTHSLPVVVDSSSSLEAIRARLQDVFEPSFYGLEQLGAIGPEHHVVFDIDILRCPDISQIKRWLARRPRGRKVVFTVDKACWHARVQAAALGASGVCHRPLDARALMAILMGEFGSLTDGSSRPMLRSFPGVGPALDALESIFVSSYAGTPLDLKVIDFAGAALMTKHRRNRRWRLDRCRSLASQPDLPALPSGDRDRRRVHPASGPVARRSAAAGVCGHAARYRKGAGARGGPGEAERA